MGRCISPGNNNNGVHRLELSFTVKQSTNLFVEIGVNLLRWIKQVILNSPVTETCIRGGKRETQVYPKWAKVGTHAGRRTFICFALASGIPPQVVMKWTGHSDNKSMKPYIDIATRTKSDAMQKIADSWEQSE